MHPDMNIGILDISSDYSKLSFSGNAAVVAVFSWQFCVNIRLSSEDVAEAEILSFFI